jgi:ABC-type phosphate/phosphonate transport system substrate-binding protein
MITVGAVAYDPKVVTIWEGLRSYLRDEAKLPLEVVLFLSYEAQVDALLEGRIDIAWNTNLAYVQCERWSGGRAAPLAMRDTDLVWETKIVALAGGPVRSLDDLRGRTLALGSRDSGHAAILPTHFLAAHGLREDVDYRALRFDTDLGKHGDTGTSEVDVLRAVMDGRADAGAVGSPFWQGVHDKQLVPRGAVSLVWTSPPFHHCMFTARVGLPAADGQGFAKALFAMRWDDPRHRAILEAEGLKEWVLPRSEGYASLREAAQEQGLFARRA